MITSMNQTTPLRRRSRIAACMLGVTAVASLATVVSTAPAGAAPGERGAHRVVHHDARHDVLRFDTDTEKRRPAPGNRDADITRTVVDHRARTLDLTVRVRELKRSAYRLALAEILTSDGHRFMFTVDYSRKPIDGRLRLERFASGEEVACKGATWGLRPGVDEVDASVPRSCLGDPAWLRVGLAVVGAPMNLETSVGDDSRAHGRVGDDHLVLGPRQPHAR